MYKQNRVQDAGKIILYLALFLENSQKPKNMTCFLLPTGKDVVLSF
jgi:hypothetical protein